MARTDSTPRGAAGGLVPGGSGKPAGKKPGTQNWATRLRRALKDGEDDAIARDIVESALKGSGVDRPFVLDRLEPQPRRRPVRIPHATGRPTAPRGPGVEGPARRG